MSDKSILEIIAEVARDPSSDPEKLRIVIDLHQSLRQEERERQFAEAMHAAQAQMRQVARNARNNTTNSRYATLDKIDEEIRPIYSQHGFSLSFGMPQNTETGVEMVCTVFHTNGLAREYRIGGALDNKGVKGLINKTDIQAVGSTVSYLRKYLVTMIFNIVMSDEDNDGQDTRKLTAQQAAEIEELLKKSGGEKEKFLRWIGVEAIEDMTPAQAARARAAIIQKMKANASIEQGTSP